MGRWLCIVLCASGGCTRSLSARAEQPPPSETECTLQTPLQEGIPGSPGHLIASDVNPNGASELATLMRSMLHDLESTRAQLLKNEKSRPLWNRHRKIRCAWPTSLDDRNPTFDAFALNYLKQLQAFDEAQSQRPEAYQKVVTACLTCHENTCDGPMERIRKLKLP